MKLVIRQFSSASSYFFTLRSKYSGHPWYCRHRGCCCYYYYYYYYYCSHLFYSWFFILDSIGQA